MYIKKSDLYYLSGLFDGEESIFITHAKSASIGTNRKDTYIVCVAVQMISTYAVKRFQTLFPGMYYTHYKTRTGKPLAYWSRKGQKAIDFLKKIEPFLKEKKPQALIAMKFKTNKNFINARLTDKDVNRRKELRDRIRTLNIKTNHDRD